MTNPTGLSLEAIATSSPHYVASSAPQVVRWFPEPRTRGTFGLFISCVATLVLSVWTSLHLNIPTKSESLAHRFVHKLWWMLLGVFAPELVVYTAWRQWMSAKILCRKVNHVYDQVSDNDDVKPTQQWTLVQAFYAAMGGFVFEINSSADPFLVSEYMTSDSSATISSQYITLTSHGVLLLAKCGHLPHLSEASIADKSNADPLANVLVCMQATWYLLQYIGRLVGRLPITLLETNTLAHALCALTIYVLWWSKPLDIKNPTVISSNWVRPFCQYMWMCNSMSGKNQDLEQALFTVEGDQVELVDSYRNSDDFPTQHMDLVREVIKRYPGEMTYCPNPWKLHERRVLMAEYVVPHASNWPGSELLEMDYFSGYLIPITLSFVSALYGGLHATAWNNFFSTWQKCYLWRASSLTLACTGVILCLFGTFYALNVSWDNPLEASNWSGFLISCAFCLIALGYVVCRVFLVVEAFISIREVPTGVYQNTV